ncbi:protein SRC2-like isoform X2 [Rhododendron vialii]|uniref:protein SRC2-like isoform X2 n=1 Tax=Rhododendron vialii TaxID=182163 RepID=UPI00265DF5B6|nr:protein SRC2-like isoform X2 [Rhododendron vialii]
MEYRPLEVTIISAKGLKDIGHLSKMDVYVISTISGDPWTHKTPVDKDGGSHPSWDFTMKFTVDETAIQANSLNLVFQLRHERTLLADKDIGEVHVPVKELLGNAAGDDKPAVLAEYPVRNPSGKDEGTSSIHPPPVNVPDPNTPPAFPAGNPPGLPFQLPAGYPPPAMGQYGYPGYPPPPPLGTGYPPMEPGYGYPPVQQQQHPPRRNHYAQSAGLVGALIGAMVIGENLGN